MSMMWEASLVSNRQHFLFVHIRTYVHTSYSCIFYTSVIYVYVRCMESFSMHYQSQYPILVPMKMVNAAKHMHSEQMNEVREMGRKGERE